MRKTAGDILHNAIIRQTDKELADMKEKRARGEIVRGRDTALIWENMFVIYHQSGTKEFCIEKSGMDKRRFEKSVDTV